MDEPLTRSQQKLRGHKIAEMAIYQLHDWIDACKKMELWVKAPASRKAWKKHGEEALAELNRRLST